MKNKKFISIASSLGLSVSLLAGCSLDTPENPDKDKDKDEVNHNSSGGGAGAVGGAVVGGSKGIGSGKGGATS